MTLSTMQPAPAPAPTVAPRSVSRPASLALQHRRDVNEPPRRPTAGPEATTTPDPSTTDINATTNNNNTSTTTTDAITTTTTTINANRWSHSTTSSSRSHQSRHPPSPHHRRPSTSRTLPIAGPGGFSAAAAATISSSSTSTSSSAAAHSANGAPALTQSPTRPPSHRSHTANPRSPSPSLRHPHARTPQTDPPLPLTPYHTQSFALSTTSYPPHYRPASRAKTDRLPAKSYQPSSSAGHRSTSSREHPNLASTATPTTESRTSTTRSRNRSRSHHRNRTRSNTTSRTRDHRPSDDTQSAIAEDSSHETPLRVRERREKDKKAMLSKALQKANTAVLLDNAQNVGGAIEAYEDACKLLEQVMTRSSQDEDRRKLDAIRATYTTRIEELKRLDPSYSHPSGKSLPARPLAGESLHEQRSKLPSSQDKDDDDDDAESVIIETAVMTRIIDDRPIDDPAEDALGKTTPAALSALHQLPLRKAESGAARESVISTAIRDVQRNMRTPQFHLQPPPAKLAGTEQAIPTPLLLASPMDRSYMPPPLSPKRSASPRFTTAKSTTHSSDEPNTRLQPQQSTQPGHKRAHSTESTSWLDTIEESGGSVGSSSVHSLSPGGLRRKHIRTTSGGTEAEFDAALDAAVEAAYDQGLEPFDDNNNNPNDDENDNNEEEEEDEDKDGEDEAPVSADLIKARLRNVELAKERVREAEREEAIAAAKYRYKETQLRNEALPHVLESTEVPYDAEADEEERLLDEITREYMLDGFDFDLQTKAALPRQSDSSGFSGSMYGSSVSSHRTTGGTSLSTVAEVMHPTTSSNPSSSPPSFFTSKTQQLLHSPPAVATPSGALPALPPVLESQPPQVSNGNRNGVDDKSKGSENVNDDDAAAAAAAAASEKTSQSGAISQDAGSARGRKLSGQNAKPLKIETSLPPVPAVLQTERPPVPAKDSPASDPLSPQSSAAAAFAIESSLDTTFKLPPLLPATFQNGLGVPFSQSNLPSPADTVATISPATTVLSHGIAHEVGLVPGSPKGGRTSALGIRKNKSSLSLKQRNLSISSPEGSETSIGTPLSTTFSMTGRKPSNVGLTMATPSIPSFHVDGLSSGGIHLFESDIHSPFSPGSPSPTVANAPVPLEPCPEAHFLRPFWLMRCFYQTIAHPRGGYLSNKLFIPRDVWRVKGVKLKNVEDKIANCDLLTAALQKLASVDTFDADAILEEMQSLEVVLDQVQAQLAKKLGNEVGVQSVATLFKDATTIGEGAASLDGGSKGSHGLQDHALSKSAVTQGKSYLTSWRKLRSKNSGVNLTSLTSTGGKSDMPKDTLVMATLPMTSLPMIRFAKREISSVVFEGPNAGYMGSLARLFDSVQVLDQIARQVEDPGLRHSSPTHVGLELSTRHAAEFFGFYICRFVLADVSMLLDKFIKRGSEWVLQ